MRNLGQRGKGEHLLAGRNERLDGLQAAILRVKLPHLDAWNDARREIAGQYDQGLPDDIRTLPARPEASCVYHLFPVRVEDRRRLAEHLAQAGVQTGVHYDPALTQQPPCADAPRPAAGCPVSEAWAREELSLPMWEGLTSEAVARVVEACAGARVG